MYTVNYDIDSACMLVSTLLTGEESNREVTLRVVLTSVDMRAVPSKDAEKGEQGEWGGTCAALTLRTLSCSLALYYCLLSLCYCMYMSFLLIHVHNFFGTSSWTSSAVMIKIYVLLR